MGFFNKKNKKEKLPEFNANIKFANSMYFDDKNRLINTSFKKLHLKLDEYIKYEDISDFNAIEDGNQILKSGLGSAIGGGILFGPAGAIVGAIVGKGGKKSYTEELSIELIFKDGNSKKIYLISSKTKHTSFTYKSFSKDFKGIITKLEEL